MKCWTVRFITLHAHCSRSKEFFSTSATRQTRTRVCVQKIMTATSQSPGTGIFIVHTDTHRKCETLVGHINHNVACEHKRPCLRIVFLCRLVCACLCVRVCVFTVSLQNKTNSANPCPDLPNTQFSGCLPFKRQLALFSKHLKHRRNQRAKTNSFYLKHYVRGA